MNDLEMRLGKDITDILKKKNVVVFRSTNTNQPYALFKIKDEEGAVADFGNGLYMVTAKNHEPKKSPRIKENIN